MSYYQQHSTCSPHYNCTRMFQEGLYKVDDTHQDTNRRTHRYLNTKRHRIIITTTIIFDHRLQVHVIVSLHTSPRGSSNCKQLFQTTTALLCCQAALHKILLFFAMSSGTLNTMPFHSACSHQLCFWNCVFIGNWISAAVPSWRFKSYEKILLYH